MPTGKGSYGSKVGRPSKAKKPEHSKTKKAKKRAKRKRETEAERKEVFNKIRREAFSSEGRGKADKHFIMYKEGLKDPETRRHTLKQYDKRKLKLFGD